MKFLVSLFLFTISNISFSQSNQINIQLRTPFQIDQQKAEINYSWGSEIKKANTFNFGLDALLNYKYNRLSFFIGAGILRNKINISRNYDHQALNPNTDSLPIGTKTENYRYIIVRSPVGFNFNVFPKNKLDLTIGLEHNFNFLLSRKYNGATPFDGANTSHNGFDYYGNSIHFNLSISPFESISSIKLMPFVRFYNRYKNDRFLYENENEFSTREFDSFGLTAIYLFK